MSVETFSQDLTISAWSTSPKIAGTGSWALSRRELQMATTILKAGWRVFQEGVADIVTTEYTIKNSEHDLQSSTRSLRGLELESEHTPLKLGSCCAIVRNIRVTH